MAKMVKTRVPVTTIEMLVADAQNETLNKVQTRYPYRVAQTKKLERNLRAELEAQNLTLVRISSLVVDYKKYQMPVETFVTLGEEVVEED